jgi:S1-C subfamily serine protease
MVWVRMIFPRSPHVRTVHLECACRAASAGSTGTGFVTRGTDGQTYLVTNGHVFTGRHPDTGLPLDPSGFADPDLVRVWYHSADHFGSWNAKVHDLRDPQSGTPKWRQHPTGLSVDVVALRVEIESDVRAYLLELALATTDMMVSPSEPVSIVGFPFGLSVDGKLPIWKTGHVASDIDVSYLGKPAFLIDATTTPGMSGSPVIARRIGMYQTKGGGIVMGSTTANRFLGVYSGRIRADSDIGIVWKPDVLTAILP